MATEDFSFFAQEAPGLFFLVGITPADQDPRQAAPNHSPLFKVDEAGLVRACEACCTWSPIIPAAAPRKPHVRL